MALPLAFKEKRTSMIYLGSQRMNKGKEGLRFVAESSTKKKKSKKNKKKKKHTATPTPHVPFDICYTEEDRE
jgi:hypothetical protein